MVMAELATTVADQWWVLLVRGMIGIVFGALFIFYPSITLVALLYLFGAYALVDGVFALIQAFRLGIHSDRWWPLVFEAIVGIPVGIVFFRFTGFSPLSVAFLIPIWPIPPALFDLL